MLGLDKKEIHFIKMEGIMDSVDLFGEGPSSVMNLQRSIGTSAFFNTESRPIEDWIITDLDNFLLGNPHIK